jgi:phosphatidylglycerophosphatase A
VGFWAAAAWLPRTFPALAAAFVLFRLFDAYKPGPLQALERLPGGWGTLADDLGAGACANLLTRVMIAWMPSWFAGAA